MSTTPTATNEYVAPVANPMSRLANILEASREVGLEFPMVGGGAVGDPEHGHCVGAFAHAGSERDRRPQVGLVVQALHRGPERVLAELLARALDGLADDLADAPSDEPEIVGHLVGIHVAVGRLV